MVEWSKVKTVHLMGIAGTGMGAFAGMLKQAGYAVRGSDEGVYPPMSDKLADWGIAVKTPYAPENLEPAPDLVVVGNVIRKVNPEATAMRERDIPHASFPETFGHLFLEGRHPVVVAGTHGKTTTSTLLAHTLMHAGRDPGFLVGGIPQEYPESFRVGARTSATPVVVEGDEYDTAYFDKGPKFLHYRPRSLLCTSLEYDHADIYASVDEIVRRFTELFALVPEDGHIVIHADAPHLAEALAASAVKAARIERYGKGGEWVAENVEEGPLGLRFDVVNAGARAPLSLQLSGPHNVDNAVGAYVICRGLGLTHDEIAAGFASFKGVKRRMEVVGEAAGITVVDDFAHHPTAVKLTLEGARARYAGRELWALFEPRSATSCRKVFQDAYGEAFDDADRVLLAPSGRNLDPEISLDVPEVAATIARRGTPAEASSSVDAMIETVCRDAKPGAVLLCMSNGAFGGIHRRLLVALGERGVR